MSVAGTVAQWQPFAEGDPNPNTADFLWRAREVDHAGENRSTLFHVDAAGNNIGSFAAFAFIRPGGGHAELFLTRQDPAVPGFDYDTTHRTAIAHY